MLQFNSCIIPEGRCYRNDNVDAFHLQLKEAGIKFPVEMNPDTDAEVASWAKSLFLAGKISKKDKRFFMLTTLSTTKPNLKQLAATLGVKELRMAQPKDMARLLHVERGCVTALTTLMDTAGEVTSVLDAGLLASTQPLRMCAGCNDALDHSQHNISLTPVATLLSLLETSGFCSVLHVAVLWKPALS